MSATVPLYKPLALRLPCLVLFLAVFGICIGLIEQLLAHSDRTVPPLTTATPVSIDTATPTTITKSRETLICSKPTDFVTQLASFESEYSLMCSNFSKLFAPSPTSNSPSSQVVFKEWWKSLWSLTDSMSDVESTSRKCYYSTAKSPTQHSWSYNTAGCTSTPLTGSRSTISCGPGGYGGILTMANGTLTASWQGVACGARDESLLFVTEPTTTVVDATTATTAVTSVTTTNEYGRPTTIRSSIVLVVVAKPTNSANFSLNVNEVMVRDKFTSSSYFSALYLAPLLAVLVRALWETVHASLKLIEPFQRLSSAGGTLGRDSVLTQYLSSAMALHSLRRFDGGSMRTIWTLVMYTLVQLGAPLAAAAMTVRAQNVCSIGGHQVRCDPAWVVNLPVIRSLEALFAACMILLVILIALAWNYGVPLPGNPSSIAALALLANDDVLRLALQDIHPEARNGEFVNALSGRRFELVQHSEFPERAQLRMVVQQSRGLQNADAAGEQLLSPTGSAQKPQGNEHTAPEVAGHPRLLSHHNEWSVREPAQLEHFRRNTFYTTCTDLVPDILCVSASIILIAILIAYHLDYSSSHFNNFFNSQTPLSRIIFVGLAVVADIQFKNLDRRIRITEPYRRLSSRHARPETTILLQLNGTCWSNLPRCLYYLITLRDSRMLWQTIVTIIACSSDFNIIAVAGVLFSDAQTKQSALVCWSISVAITSAMLAVVAAAMVWWRMADVVRNMPRRPETIGAVLSYLYGSKMVKELAGDANHTTGPASEASAKEKLALLISSGRKFRFGRWISPVDDKLRWCVDYEGDEVVVKC